MLEARRIVAAIAASAVATAVAVLGGGVPAADAAAIQFGRVWYDSPGTDTGSNTSLNGEWIRIRNTGTTKRSLTGWTVKDKTGYTYRFGTFYLAAGATVTLYTGKGTNSSTKRYWGKTWYVWNNGSDTAYLRTSAGSLVDSCSWNSTTVDYKNC